MPTILTLSSPAKIAGDGNRESLRQAPFRRAPLGASASSRGSVAPEVHREEGTLEGSWTVSGGRRRGEQPGPLRYLLRACVPGRYYYLYHAHNSSRSLKLFYYLFYTTPLPDSARSRVPTSPPPRRRRLQRRRRRRAALLL